MGMERVDFQQDCPAAFDHFDLQETWIYFRRNVALVLLSTEFIYLYYTIWINIYIYNITELEFNSN